MKEYARPQLCSHPCANLYFTMALAYTVRDQLLHRWIKAVEQWGEGDLKIFGSLQFFALFSVKSSVYARAKYIQVVTG